MQLHQVLTQLRRQCLAGEDTSVGSTQHWQGTVLFGRMSCFHLFLGWLFGYLMVNSAGGLTHNMLIQSDD